MGSYIIMIFPSLFFLLLFFFAKTIQIEGDFVLGEPGYALKKEFIQDINMVLALSTHGPM